MSYVPRLLLKEQTKISIIWGLGEFIKSNKIVKGKAITLLHEGSETNLYAADVLTWEEEERLWKEDQLID